MTTPRQSRVVGPMSEIKKRAADAAAVVIGLLLLGGLFLLVSVPHQLFNWGFGPNWTCSPSGEHEPACVKNGDAKPMKSEDSNKWP